MRRRRRRARRPPTEPHPLAAGLTSRCSPPPSAGIAATGVIWARYSTQITPVNYNLLAVNAVMAVTGLWHLGRIYAHQSATKA